MIRVASKDSSGRENPPVQPPFASTSAVFTLLLTAYSDLTVLQSVRSRTMQSRGERPPAPEANEKRRAVARPVFKSSKEVRMLRLQRALTEAVTMKGTTTVEISTGVMGDGEFDSDREADELVTPEDE